MGIQYPTREIGPTHSPWSTLPVTAFFCLAASICKLRPAAQASSAASPFVVFMLFYPFFLLEWPLKTFQAPNINEHKIKIPKIPVKQTKTTKSIKNKAN